MLALRGMAALAVQKGACLPRLTHDALWDLGLYLTMVSCALFMLLLHALQAGKPCPLLA